LKDSEVRKAASGLSTLANEKQKEQRDKASGKKKPAKAKPMLGGNKGLAMWVLGLVEEVRRGEESKEKAGFSWPGCFWLYLPRADTRVYEDALDE
jgi:hypothetical protein